MTALLLVAAGVIAGVVYCHARRALGDRIETVAPRFANPPRAILADCDTCGRTIQDRHGRCSSCGSSAIWTLGVAVPEPTESQVSATLDKIQRHAEIAARVRAKHGVVAAESKVQS